MYVSVYTYSVIPLFPIYPLKRGVDFYIKYSRIKEQKINDIENGS